MRKTMVVTIGVLLLLSACNNAALKNVDAEQKTMLSGMLRFELFYGAPGFGEDTVNDEKEQTYILHLNPPVLFRDTGLLASFTDEHVNLDTLTYDTVSTIHVRFDPDSKVNGKNLRKLVGKEIMLECSLYGAFDGHHHAPAVTEEVYSIKSK